ncbi:MAG: transposase [Anaerolineales bacterium]
MAKAQITVPLEIADVRILQTAMGEGGELIITVESIKKETACRKCGRWITKLHGQDEWVISRHLPVFGRPSYLRYRPKRYPCQDCEGHPTTTQSPEWQDANSPHSFAYDNHILLQLVNSTVEDVSLKEGLSYASVDWTMMADLEILGLDEIALKKGQGNYITLVTGRFQDGEIVILAVLPGHEKAEVVEFLRLIPQRILRRVQAVCCDLWEVSSWRHATPASKRCAQRSQRHGSWPTVSMLPDTIASQSIN